MDTVASPGLGLSEAPRSILVNLLIHGPTSRADLARQSGLSPASMTRITKLMVGSGLLVEKDAAPPVRTGRPSLPLAVNVDHGHLIGVNLTASEIHLVRTDLRARLLTTETVAISSADPGLVAAQIVSAIRSQTRIDRSVMAVGISLAGPVAPGADVVRMSPFLGWEQVPLAEMIRSGTGLPTVVENDVRALTAAEHWFGAAAGVHDFAVVTIGTGVGCGIVVNDRLLDSASGGAGQVGHLPVTANGPLCERGHRGCVRAYLSSTSIVRQVAAATGRHTLDYETVLLMAADGDLVASRVVQDAGYALGVVIGTVAAIAGPAKVLVSGEGANLVPLVLDIVRARAAEVQHWTIPEVPIEVVPFTFTEWARGAAVIALRRQVEDPVAVDA